MKFSTSTSSVHRIFHFPFSIISLLFFVCNTSAQDLSKLSYAELQNNIMLHYQNSALDKAISTTEFAINKAKKEFGENDSTFAQYTFLLGKIYNNVGDYKKAEPFLVQAKNIFAQVSGTKNINYTDALSALSNLYTLSGNLAKAEEMSLEANDNYAATYGKESINYARGLYVLAMIYVEQGRMDEALANLILQEKIIKTLYEKKATEPLYYVFASMDLADIYQNMGQYEQAIPLYLQAQQIYLQNKENNQGYYAVILGNLAQAYMEKGRNSEAESLFLEAIEVRAKLGKKESEYSVILNNLAKFYIKTNRHAEAEKLLLEVLDINLGLFGKEHRTTLHIIGALGGLYYKTNDYKKAEEYFLQTANISENLYGKKHSTYHASLNQLALVHYKTGNYQQSWEDIRQLIYHITDLTLKSPIHTPWIDSLKKSETTSYINFTSIIIALETIYFLLDKEQKKQEQYLITDLGLYLINQHRDKLTGSEDKLRLLELSNKWMQLSLKILDPERQKNIAFGIAEQNKSVLLLQATKAEKAYQLGELPDSLVVLDKNLVKERDKLEANLLENRPKKEKDSLRTVLVQINQNIENFKIMVGEKYPKYARLKYKAIDAKVEDVQQALSDKTALLEYAIGDSMVYIFYIDKNSSKLIHKTLEIKLLNEKIKNFHRVLSNYKFITTEKETAYRQYTENAQWFYENLVAPVLSNANKINELIIVSDGELGHLPFEAFLVEKAPQKETDYHKLHYLINDYRISYNYSATIWMSSKSQEKNKNNGQLLAMATNYNIKLEQNKIDWRLPTHQHLRTKLKALPAARKEVETLAETFNGFFGLDKEASEKVFKEKAGDYAVIHLAMHGLLDPKGPILSSLAFTEDGDSVENNFLHAYEISKMKLNADLVVLSACETGYGRFEKGNGIASLAQAFAYAGAPAMIVSLWQVNDYATSEIMKILYQNLADGMKKDEALQQAKIQYMKNAKGIFAHPAFWSPFILMGNTDGITLGRTRGLAPTWIIGIGLAVLGGIAFAMRNRRKEKIS